VIGIEPRASHMLGKFSIVDPFPQTYSYPSYHTHQLHETRIILGSAEFLFPGFAEDTKLQPIHLCSICPYTWS
jgi:hypothetical protein